MEWIVSQFYDIAQSLVKMGQCRRKCVTKEILKLADDSIILSKLNNASDVTLLH